MGENAPSSPNRLWVAVVAVLLIGAVVVLLWSRSQGGGDRDETPDDVALDGTNTARLPHVSQEDGTQPAPGADASEDAQDVSMDPGAQARLPDHVSEPPPGIDELPDRSTNIPPPPTLPETPDWKLDKSLRMAELLEDRAQRIEQELANAEAAGDEDRAHDRRVMLQRTEYRLEDLANEIEALEAEVEAGGWEEELVAAQAARAEWEAQYGDQDHPYHPPSTHSYSDEEPAPE